MKITKRWSEETSEAKEWRKEEKKTDAAQNTEKEYTDIHRLIDLFLGNAFTVYIFLSFSLSLSLSLAVCVCVHFNLMPCLMLCEPQCIDVCFCLATLSKYKVDEKCDENLVENELKRKTWKKNEKNQEKKRIMHRRLLSRSRSYLVVSMTTAVFQVYLRVCHILTHLIRNAFHIRDQRFL